MPEDTFDRIAARIGAASLSPAPWRGLLDDLTSYAGARGAAIIPLHGTPHRMEFTESLGGLFESYVNDGWSQRDYRYRGVAGMARRGISVDQDFVDADTMRTEPYYEHFLGRHGLRFYAGVGLREGAESWVVAFQRRPGDGYFDADEQERLLRLAVPLHRAVAVSRALSDAHATGTVDALSGRSRACLLLDRHGRVAYLNAAAEGLLGDLFDVRQGRISFRSGESTRDAWTRIRASLAVSGQAAPATPFLVRDGASVAAVRVLRLAGAHDGVFGRYGVLVEIRVLAQGMTVDVRMVTQAYDLTRREADLLQAFLRTSSLATAARDVGMAYETARSHLKSVFAKTGTSSQAGLVSLMASVAS